MADKLNWGYEKHDFSSIKETLINYFPFDDHYRYNEENIRDFKGKKDIGEILNDNFFNDKNYKEKWGKFKKYLKEKLRRPIHESMCAFYPCYSGIVTLKKEKNKGLTYTKELHYFISLLGPYYTIFGVDNCQLVLEELKPMATRGDELLTLSYDANLVITVSPYLEFQELFQDLQKNIADYFPSYKFIPYNILLKKIEGISQFYPDTEEHGRNIVFSGLFRPDIVLNSKTRGNKHFGFDEWLLVKKLDKSRIDKIKADLIEKSMNVGSTDLIRKVWKFKTSNRLLEISENFAFGMVPIQVLDLTDEKYITIISKEDEEPLISKYSVVKNEIIIDQFKNNLGFRIKEFDSKELKLILHLNFNFENNKEIKGDILEMVFELYQ